MSGWVPGIVKQKCDEPRSYTVQTPNGRVVRRNRKFLQELSPEAANKLSFHSDQNKQPIRVDVDNEPTKETTPRENAKKVQFKRDCKSCKY